MIPVPLSIAVLSASSFLSGPPVNANAGIATGTGAAKAAGYGLTPVLATGAGTVLGAGYGLTPREATAAGTACTPHVKFATILGTPHSGPATPGHFAGDDPTSDVGEPGNLGVDIGEPDDPTGT